MKEAPKMPAVSFSGDRPIYGQQEEAKKVSYPAYGVGLAVDLSAAKKPLTNAVEAAEDSGKSIYQTIREKSAQDSSSSPEIRAHNLARRLGCSLEEAYEEILRQDREDDQQIVRISGDSFRVAWRSETVVVLEKI